MSLDFGFEVEEGGGAATVVVVSVVVVEEDAMRTQVEDRSCLRMVLLMGESCASLYSFLFSGFGGSLRLWSSLLADLIKEGGIGAGLYMWGREEGRREENK